MPTRSLSPQQERSRDTEARLLQATMQMLERGGLDAATIPQIAAIAGVAPASVYRRFQNRDALVRAALLRALETGAATSRVTLRLESFTDRTLEGVVRALVVVVLAQYRAQPGLMRAFTRFVETDSDDAFRRQALAIVAGNFAGITELLLAFRHEIPHADPRRVITFALLTMATVIEVRALEQVSMWRELLPLSDRALETELTRAVVAYLRASNGGPTAPRRKR